MFDKISSGKIYGNTGNQFSAIEIDGDGVLIRNAADEMDSSGNLVPAGSDEVLSASRSNGTTINASYIKTGVIDANLMRAGLIQTVPSWNTKWYGAPEDHAAVQMGFTGGSIAATAVSTGTGTVSLTLPGGHGLITGDYVRVSGLYFTAGTLLGGVGLNLPTNGPLDYASATVATNTLTYSKADITSGLTASTASTVYVGKAHTITAVVRSFDNPENPAELSTVVVTTGAAHDFSVGNYVELVNVAPTIDGVAYITAVTSTTFTFKQRFGADIELDLAEVDSVLPDLGAPVAIKVLKSYTQNADGSIHITSGTVDSTLIVGEIAATEITIGVGGTIARVGSYPDAVSPTFQGFWAGAADPASAGFSVNTAGALNATGATISGALTATTLTATGSGSIGGWTIGSTSLTSGSGSTRVGLDNGGTNPAIYAGSSTPASAPFRVTNAGAVTATSGAIGGWTLGSTSLTSGSGATTVGLDSGGTNPSIYAGSATPASAPFRVTNAGAVTASNLTVTGGSISIGNFLLSTAGNITDKLVIQQKFITNENGVDLISTSSTGGQAYALSKSVSDGIYTGVQNGSFSAGPPTPASNIDNSTNPIPYWTYSSSSASITAKVNTDTGTGSGKKLTFTIASGATTGANAYIERYISIPASVARSYTFQPRVAWRDATASATDVIGYIETQYYANDATTKTGTQGAKTVIITGASPNTPTAGTVRYTYTADANNTIVAGDNMYVYETTSSVSGAYNLNGIVKAATTTTFDIAGTPSGTYTSGGVARQYLSGYNLLGTIKSGIAAGYNGFETWANPNATGNVPADGAYLRVRVGVRVLSTTSASRIAEVAEVRLDRGPIQLLVADQTNPGDYGYGGVWLSGGQLYIRPNETGPGYDATANLPYAGSTGVRNPGINLFATNGNIALNPSSTGSVVVQSKSVANGGSVSAVPLKVYGIASQTGNLQQWLDNSNNVLAHVTAAGNINTTADVNVSGTIGVLGDINIGVSDTSVAGNITFKGGNGGSIRAFSASAGNDSIGIYNTAGSAYAPLVASGFYPNQGSSYLSHNGTNFTMNDTLAITGALSTTSTISAGSTISTSGNVTATGSITATSNLLSNGAGLFHDTPTGVTLASGSTVGRTALWTLNSGTQYNLQRWTSTSTAVLKKNIRNTDLAPEQIYNLSLVDFEYDLDKFTELYPHINVEATDKQRGVIWEEVADVMPEAAVNGYGPGDPPTIDWEKLYFGALVAIQDLNERTTALEARIAELNTGA